MQTGILASARILLLAVAAACITPSRADVTLTLVDGQGKTLPGIACATEGSTAVSDAQGKLTLRAALTSILLEGRSGGEASLTRIPLAPGEKATVVVSDARGRLVLNRQFAMGERIEVPGQNRGVFFVRVHSHDFRAQGRMTSLAGTLAFEGVAIRTSSRALARASAVAANEVVATCTRAGSTPQVYRLKDGTSLTIDFSRPPLVPLYDEKTILEPENIIVTDSAIITRFNDRARDRHAREDQYNTYDHYLSHYWENRTSRIQITDYIAKGGKKIRVDQWTLWPLDSTAREFRAFYRGIGTVAEYHYNANMSVDPNDSLHYFTEFSQNGREGRPAKVGDRMEIEVSQFLRKEGLVGRDNYYGTPFLYIIGQGGLVPWYTKGVFGDGATEREDSYPLPETEWLGGRTTIHQQYTDEPHDMFVQMATNTAPQNGQPFMLGRRVDHTSFVDGSHDEPDNPVWDEMAGKSGPNFINVSCVACHYKNGRALPPEAGKALDQYVFKVGDAEGNPHPRLGSVLQPRGGNEGSVTLAGWQDTAGLRKPTYAFSGEAPARYSARISPQLVGMGLLEAVPESEIISRADPDDADKDGISGRIRVTADFKTGQPRLGRFGWKAGKPDVAHQVAGALNTDMGVTTSLLKSHDCGASQTGCGADGVELADEHLQNLVDYIRLLGVRASRTYEDPTAKRGEGLFQQAGCVSCHVPTHTTSAFHPKAELRNQTIRPYTDLLLHDMGPGLADNLPEGEATGAEWRTAPLWNIGLTAGVSGGEAYLHDGRARSLKEAVLWHGGEAQAAADKFKAMSAGDQDALIRFLKSL